MTSATHLCFLVLAVSSASRAENQTTTPLQVTKNNTDPAPTLLPSSEAPTKDAVSNTTANQTSATTGSEGGFNGTVGVSSAATTATTMPGSPVSIATSSDSKPVVDKPGMDKPRHFPGGYVILVLIILVIVVLCGILFFLRRASRTYSFDLQRPLPARRLSEPTGTFELVNLDDLDPLTDGDQVTLDDLSPALISNGTTPQAEDKAPNGQMTATRGSMDATPQEEPGANSADASSTSDTSDEPVDETSNSISVLMDTPGKEEQNKATNPCVCATDPFIEINLEDGPQGDPSTTTPGNPSSVLPFSSSPTSSLD